MFWIITKETTAGDIAVTGTYLLTIKAGIEAAGYTCCIWDGKSKIDKKKDYLIFDECKIASLYILKGYHNIIVWIQGVVPEEAIMKGYAKYRYIVHSFLEYITLRKSKLVFLCSDAMKKHYEKKYRIGISSKSIIMPCFNETGVDLASFHNPEKYQKDTFLYIGTLNVWQCFEETLQIYKAIEEKKLGETCLYIYTPSQVKAIAALKKYKVKNYKVGYLPAEQLGKNIGKFKYGFVLRRNNIVNQVATPTKLSNYIAHGIIPIYSDCLKSFDEYEKKSNGYGVVCNIEEPKEGVTRILNNMQENIPHSEMKRWCENTFNTYYNQEKYIQLIERYIKKILLK